MQAWGRTESWGVEGWGGRGVACLTTWFPTLERQNHARELVQGLSLSEWDGIITVSGDGLLYEVGQEPQALSPGGTVETRNSTQVSGLRPSRC